MKGGKRDTNDFLSCSHTVMQLVKDASMKRGHNWGGGALAFLSFHRSQSVAIEKTETV